MSCIRKLGSARGDERRRGTERALWLAMIKHIVPKVGAMGEVMMWQ